MSNSLIITNNGAITDDLAQDASGSDFQLIHGTYDKTTGIFHPTDANDAIMGGGACKSLSLNGGDAYLVINLGTPDPTVETPPAS